MTSIKSPSLPSISDDTPSIYFTFPFNFTFFLFFGVNREKNVAYIMVAVSKPSGWHKGGKMLFIYLYISCLHPIYYRGDRKEKNSVCVQ